MVYEVILIVFQLLSYPKEKVIRFVIAEPFAYEKSALLFSPKKACVFAEPVFFDIFVLNRNNSVIKAMHSKVVCPLILPYTW